MSPRLTLCTIVLVLLCACGSDPTLTAGEPPDRTPASEDPVQQTTEDPPGSSNELVVCERMSQSDTSDTPHTSSFLADTQLWMRVDDFTGEEAQRAAENSGETTVRVQRVEDGVPNDDIELVTVLLLGMEPEPLLAALADPDVDDVYLAVSRHDGSLVDSEFIVRSSFATFADGSGLFIGGCRAALLNGYVSQQHGPTMESFRNGFLTRTAEGLVVFAENADLPPEHATTVIVGPRVNILTADSETGRGMNALSQFTLRYDPDLNCLYHDEPDNNGEPGTGGRVVIEWPFGYTAIVDNGQVDVLDTTGTAVARTNTTFQIGGGGVGYNGDHCNAIGIWIAHGAPMSAESSAQDSTEAPADPSAEASETSVIPVTIDTYEVEGDQTLALLLGVCQPVGAEVEVTETNQQVVIAITEMVTLLATNETGEDVDRPDCADVLRVTLEQPLGDRDVIDRNTGDAIIFR